MFSEKGRDRLRLGEELRYCGAGGIICNPLTSDSVTALADKIVDFIIFLAAPIAVLMTVYAGYLFITAADKQEQVKKARQTLLWVVVGVIVLILSKSAVVFVNSFLTPSP